MTVSQSTTGADVVRTSSIVVDMSPETSPAEAVVVERAVSEDWAVVASISEESGILQKLI